MRKSLKAKILIPFLILAAVLLLVFLGAKSWLVWPKNIIYKISLPFLKSSQWAGDKVSDAFSVILILKDVEEENNLLREQNRALFFENVQLKEFALENQVLRQHLGLTASRKEELVLADVIGHSPLGREYTFFLNKGQKDGVFLGQPVVAGGGYLVGRVVEAASDLAKVLLVVDPSSSVSVRIQETRASGIVKGEHGMNLIMETIPQEHNVKEGELVITSGVGGVFPKGLIVGQIEKVISSETEVFRKARVRPMVDFDKLEQVFIIKQTNAD